MTLMLCLILFVAPLSQCDVVPDQQILQSVFGTPAGYAGPLPAAQPGKPTLGTNETLVDHDYWDSDDYYVQSPADYDSFDWTVTKRIAAYSEENFLLSPLGLKLALAILTEAATGPTQAQLASVLGFDVNRTVVRTKFSSIISSLQLANPNYTLNVGSRIYVDSTVSERQRFSSIAEEFYKTELKKVDFRLPAETAAQINGWVSNLTHGNIPNLIDEDEVKGSIVLVLTTLFFKGTWKHQFNPNTTKTRAFYVTPTVQKQVPFMNVKDKFYYAESAKYDAKILRMPYLGKKFSMYIVVPNSLKGLPRVMDSLSDLRTEMLYLAERTVDVTLPKFKFDFTSILDGVLKDLGIRQAFEDTASFPGLARGQSPQNRLKISKVLQRSGIEVNELGSVAYSVTEVSLVNKFGEDEYSAGEVIANRPFLFFIEDEATRQLLFTGRVSDPLVTTAEFKAHTPSACVFLAYLQSLECIDNKRPENARLNYFDTDLLKYTTEDRSGNVVVSPASIKSTLAMLLEGASGNTEVEIRSSLRLSPNKNEFREQLNIYLSALQCNNTAAKLQNANGVFVSNKLILKKEYDRVIEKVYLTKVVSLNFLDPVGSAAIVNDWVGNQTRGLIRSLIEPAHIPPSSDVLVINALYFKSAWQHAFDRSLTRSACFRVQGACKKQVAMMEISTELNYAFVDNLRAHAVELPYEGGRYSMVLLVPQDHDGLAGLIRDLPYMSLPQICKMMEPSHVQLSLPRFTVDYSEDMVGPLRGMRITTLFSSKSNLSGIIEGGPAQINHLYHRVYVSVDEDGTVAAAASAALVVPLIEGNVQLVVDKPFAFFIKDNTLGLVLFEGKIEEPHEYVAPKKGSENNFVKSSRNSFGTRF
ncbi:uncharacterized protein LOC133515652 [Cydia pomonella]|uniref:uncharacterized protein LOC133515652 n=1 Tax=Cydia pomonella TaxID=82600 RepID=UPI002ADD3327|nr:uncharacterized protein LOC133515652 [Cydia pomonella]